MASDQEPGRNVFNVPNQLTAARLVLAMVVFALIPMQLYLAALIVFTIAAGTDWVDGYWARRFNQVTQLGRMFDPFVDKIIICGAYVLLAVEMRDIPAGIQGWMAVVVVGRELLVTAIRSFIEQRGSDFSAKLMGKLKMVAQCLAVGLALAALMWIAAASPNPDGVDPDAARAELSSEALPGWLLWSMLVVVWASVLLTIYSGIEYIVAAWKMLRA